MTSHHFVEPLVLSVSDFGWLCKWVLKPGWMHHDPSPVAAASFRLCWTEWPAPIFEGVTWEFEEQIKWPTASSFAMSWQNSKFHHLTWLQNPLPFSRGKSAGPWVVFNILYNTHTLNKIKFYVLIVSPVYCIGCTVMLLLGLLGWSSHTRSTRFSRTATNLWPSPANFLLNGSNCAASRKDNEKGFLLAFP